MKYEINNICIKNGEIWGSLYNRDYEKLQQLTKISTMQDILDYLKKRMLNADENKS